MTDEIVLSKDNQGIEGEGNRVQIETDRLHHAGMPGQISQQQGTKVDADLSVAQQEVLLGWLNDVDEESQEGTEDDAAALRRRLTGVLAGLPEAIKQHLEALMALENRVVEGHESEQSREVDRVGEHERMELEESLRRLAPLAARRADPQAEGVQRGAGSTPGARCAATCASTASRSPRSR